MGRGRNRPPRINDMRLLILALGALFVGCAQQREQAKTELDLPGPRGTNVVRLPNMWWLRPVGRQVVLGDFPVNIAVHPDGKFAAVLHSGHGQHEVVVVEIASGRVISRVSLDESFYGLAFSHNGTSLFCSGAGDETIHSFSFSGGFLGDQKTVQLREKNLRGIPGGLAVTKDADQLFVANVWGHRITEVSLTSQTVANEILIGTNKLIAFDPQKTSSEDETAIRKRAEAALDATTSEDPFPYTCVLDEKRDRLYVSLWAQAAVAVINLKDNEIITRWKTEEHPNEMILSKSGKHLFVANANRNTVSILDTDSGRTRETLVAELIPNSPPGSTPNSLALSPDEKLLFVANANINTVAVFDISELGKSRSLGFIPVGWYPTSVRVSPDSKHLLVANGKGLAPRANRHGPQPGKDPPPSIREYIGGLYRGTLSIIDLPARDRLEEQMKRYTAQAYRCMPGTNIPATLDFAKLGIKYCIYIIKENRTYDQVFGDMPEGNGDASLCLFPEHITPNHHKLAREFVLLDNFYVESEVSADGHEWTVGAYATDFVEKTWPVSYGHNKHKKYPYPAEGNFPIATPAGGYIWDRAREAGVTYRSYGEFILNGKTTNDPSVSRVPALKNHFDPWFRGFDMDYPDVRRAERYISELKRFERDGEMPRLQLLRLSSDHTSGTTAGKIAPLSAVADNDVALGMVVEAISRSKFWKQTAIFVVEDDAQNGPDHVDAHRTVALVISPYTKRNAVDSTMYSTSSMLRTMELILGLRPMSQFDALATPMYNSFSASSEFKPYKALAANVDLNERNQKTAWGSELSSKMDFAKEDAADDLLLNEVIWRSIRGADSPMPPPRRAAFVFAHSEKEDDDD
jgi:DNA-binding beta-propeller fold protein YncE